MVKSFYQADATLPDGENIPPVVDAGDDVVLNANAQSVALSATAYDPDGTIVSYLWEKLSGPAGDEIIYANRADAEVRGLASGEHIYQVTVTDNDGATESDTVKITKAAEYNLAFWEISAPTGFDKFKLVLFPLLSENAVLKFTGKYVFPPSSNQEFKTFELFKNGTSLLKVERQPGEYKYGEFEFTFINGSLIEFEKSLDVWIELFRAEFISGAGTVRPIPKVQT